MIRYVAAFFVLIFLTTSAEARRHHHHRHRIVSGTIVSHPSGCPRVAFCGCGVARYIFGTPVRTLYLARAWLKFPRTSPAPGMVAVFRRGGHVAAIINTHGDGTATVYDPNSGRHATRIHRRDISRAVIVNPRG